MSSNIKICYEDIPDGRVYVFLSSKHEEGHRLFTEIHLVEVSNDPKIGIISKQFKSLSYDLNDVASPSIQDPDENYDFETEMTHAKNMLESVFNAKNASAPYPIRFKEVKHPTTLIHDDVLTYLAAKTTSNDLIEWIQEVRGFKRVLTVR